MPSEKSNLERKIGVIAGEITAVIGLFGIFSSSVKSVQEFWERAANLTAWQAAVAGVMLVVLGLGLIVLSRRRRSVLLQPNALRLLRANPAHLVGRTDEVEQLVHLILGQPLVFLEGESGAGKSALLQAGVMPALSGNSAIIPIYLESLVGADWQREPCRFLSAALWSALGNDERKKLGLEASPSPDKATNYLALAHSTLGRMPLLIVDQFDDYQIRHRERFLLRRTWLKPAKLAAENSFWQALRDLVVDGQLHLLIVTRSDTAAGLSCVRFVEPEIYRLGRLDSQFVKPLLISLAAGSETSPVISDPDFGWTRLRDRLARDLERASVDRDDQTILPQQLKIVLSGLGALPNRVLTVAAYESVGGVAGVEAKFIESRLAKVARPHGTTETQLRSALLMLIDPASARKTVERSTDDLAPVINPAQPHTAEGVLKALEQEEVVRRRSDPATQETSWLLDHDYLTRAVREADRRANRWQRALAEGEAAFTASGESWVLKWRALQSPFTQISFLRDRMFRRFRYDEHRPYAIKSLLRFIPLFTILFIIVSIGIYERERQKDDSINNTAEDILNKLEFATDNSERDIQALLTLARSDLPTRRRVLKSVLTNADRSRVFIRKPELVVRAIAGVSPHFRIEAIEILNSAASSASQAETIMAIAMASSLFGQADALPSAWWIRAIRQTSDPIALQTLGDALRPVASKLSDAQASEAMTTFLNAIRKTSNFHTFEILKRVISDISNEFSSTQAEHALSPLLDALRQTSEPNAIKALSEGLSVIIGKLSDAQAREAVPPFLDALRQNSKPEALQLLGEGLGALPVELNDAQTLEAVNTFVNAIRKTSDLDALWALGGGLMAIVSKLSGDQAAATLSPLLDAVREVSIPESREVLNSLLKHIASKLSDSQVQQAAIPFLNTLRQTSEPNVIQALSGGFTAIAGKLSDAQAQEAITSFLGALRQTSEPKALWLLSEGLGALSVKLNDAQVRNAVTPFVDALRRTSEPRVFWLLNNGLRTIIGKLSDAQAREAVHPFLDTLRQSSEPNSLRALGKGLGALPVKLSDAQVQEAVTPFLDALRQTSEPEALQLLGEGLGALPVKLSDAQAREAVPPFLDALRQTSEPDALEALSGGLAAVFGKLSDAQAREAVPPFLGALRQTSEPDALEALSGGLAAIIDKLSDAQVREAVTPFLDALRQTSEPKALWTLSRGLTAIIGKLSDAQAREAAPPFLDALRRTSEPSALWPLTEGLKALPVKLSDAQVQEAVTPFLDALRQTSEPEALQLLGEGLGALPVKLSDAQAREAVPPFLDALRQTSEPDALEALSGGLAAVFGKLSDAQAREAVPPFLGALRQTSEPDALEALSGGLAAIIDKLSDAQVREAVTPFLDALRQTSEPDDLRSLSSGLAAIIVKLSNARVREAVPPFLDALRQTSEPNTLQILGEELGALPVELSDTQAQEAVTLFLDILENNKEPHIILALGNGLKAFAAKVDPHSAKLINSIAIKVINQTSNFEIFNIYSELFTISFINDSPHANISTVLEVIKNPMSFATTNIIINNYIKKTNVKDLRYSNEPWAIWQFVEWILTKQKSGDFKEIDLNIPFNPSST